MTVKYRTQPVDDVEVFYRKAGPADAPVVLLLHGFPTSSHMFRDLIPGLAGQFQVIAPHLPGFGNTVAPPCGSFDYTFDNLARVISAFVDALGLTRYVRYVYDYGVPTGYRLALAHPERVAAIISQNGNAFVEGFSEAWGSWEAYWRSPTPEERNHHERIARTKRPLLWLPRRRALGCPLREREPDTWDGPSLGVKASVAIAIPLGSRGSLGRRGGVVKEWAGSRTASSGGAT